MSSSSLTDLELLRRTVGAGSVPESLVQSLQRVAFWTAIVLPFLHLPLLATGLPSQSTTIAFVVLVALNICALLVGHPDE